MFNETSFSNLSDLGIYLEPGPAQEASTSDTGIIGIKRPWPGFHCMSLACEGRGPINSAVESPPYQVSPGTQPPVANGKAPTASATSGFDLGSLLSGTILGLPSWLVIGGAAWFLFFRKGR